MKSILGVAIFPLFICLAVIILTVLVIIFALRRGTRTINKQAEQVITEKRSASSANTRWARGDLQGEPTNATQAPALQACPACGGENPVGSSACTYCGRKL